MSLAYQHPSKTPQLRFEEFSGEWEEKGLVEFVSSYKGGAPLKPKDFISNSKFEVIPKKAIQANGKLLLDTNNPTFCTEIFSKNNDRSIIDNSYLVTTLRDLVPSGPNIGYIVKNNYKNKLLLAQGVYGFKIDENLDENFLLHISNRIEYRRIMQKIMVGSTQVHIRTQDFFKMLLTLPSKQEQEKIASFLNAVDTKIEQLTSKRRLLQEYKKSTMQKIFSQEIRFKDDDGSEYAEWVERKLGNIADVRDGTHDSPKYYNKGFPLITSKNLLKNGSIDFDNVNLILEDDYKNINKRSNVSKGDVLFGMIGTIGNPVLVHHDGFAIKNIALIKEKDLLKNYFLIQYLKSSLIEKQFHKQNTGGTQKFIALGVIRNLIIKTPSLKEQTKIANFLSSIDSKIEQTQTQLNATKEFKKALLQQMFV